jgi:hypothetical protein
MVQQSKKEISLGDDFGDVSVSVNGTRVDIHTDGSILAYTHSDVDAYTSGSVKAHPAVNDDANPAELVKSAPKIGDTMPDGTIFAGVSPDTGKAMFATAADAPLSYTFNEARKYAKDLDAHGHQDWRVPTKDELNVLFNNRAAIGGFDVTGSYPADRHWSSSTYGGWDAWGQRFSDGYQYIINKDNHSSLRCVR